MNERNDEVHICADPSCPVCWLYDRAAPGWADRVRVAFRDACINGHPRTDATTRVGKNGWRACTLCERERRQRDRKRRRGVA